MYQSYSKYKHKSSFFMFFVLAVMLALFIYSAKSFFISSDAVADANSMTKEKVEFIVKDFINNHPELIIESLRSSQEKMMKESLLKSQELVTNKRAEIENTDNSPFIGGEKAKIVIVEFFDYRCGHCKSANKVIRELLNNDKNVKFVYKELPILGQDSELAAQYAFAVYKLDTKKYETFHNKLMEMQQIDKESLDKLVVESGINLAALKNTIDTSVVTDGLKEVKELARTIQIQGTPAFIINGMLMSGPADLSNFRSKIAEINKQQLK